MRGLLFLLSGLLLAGPTCAISVSDDRQNIVTLEQAARRIVTLAPHATELVIAAGARARLVGAPAGAGRLPDDGVIDIGGPGPLDRERLLRLQPDLVIAWYSGNRPADLAWIERQGTAVFFSEPASLSTIANAIRAIGKLSDTLHQAAHTATSFEAAIRTRCAALPPLPAYVEVWNRPPMTVGGRHWLNDVLRAAGYQNLYADQPRGVFAVSSEAHRHRQDVVRIVLTPSADPNSDTILSELLARPGPRLADAVQHLCHRRLGDDPD